MDMRTCVITSTNVDALNKVLMDMYEDGWILRGTVSIIADRGACTYYATLEVQDRVGYPPPRK
jgi:hypothetical protein